MVSLRQLHLFGNALTGVIPPAFSDLPNLKHLVGMRTLACVHGHTAIHQLCRGP